MREMVDRIHEDTLAIPSTIFVETEEEIHFKNVTSHMTSLGRNKDYISLQF